MAASNYVRVWDIPTRLFHWIVVVLVAVSWYSADRDLLSIHLWSGLALLTLLVFRLTWGFVGSTTARFSDFLHPIPRIVRYLNALARSEKLLYAGHNPAGGLMVIALLSALLAQIITGVFANDGIGFNGPLAIQVSAETSDWLTELHRTLFKLILLLVWCHVVAVGFYWFVKGDDLVRPMFTGKKHRAHVPLDARIRFTSAYWALLLLTLCASTIASVLVWFGDG